MTPKPKSAFITCRVTPKVRTKFYARVSQYELSPSDALREIIEAFIEDRLILIAPSKKGTIYHES